MPSHPCFLEPVSLACRDTGRSMPQVRACCSPCRKDSRDFIAGPSEYAIGASVFKLGGAIRFSSARRNSPDRHPIHTGRSCGSPWGNEAECSARASRPQGNWISIQARARVAGRPVKSRFVAVDSWCPQASKGSGSSSLRPMTSVARHEPVSRPPCLPDVSRSAHGRSSFPSRARHGRPARPSVARQETG